MSTEYPKIPTLFARNLDFSLNTTQFKHPVLGTISKWRTTEKIHGMNIRVIVEGGGDSVVFKGRTDAAVLPGPLEQELQRLFPIVDRIRNAAFSYPGHIVLYGEGYGGKIQQGTLYSVSQKFILFDAKVGHSWLSLEELKVFADALQIDIVPELQTMSIPEIVDMVKTPFKSVIGSALAEGVVAQPISPLFNNYGTPLRIKLKTSDFTKHRGGV